MYDWEPLALARPVECHDREALRAQLDGHLPKEVAGAGGTGLAISLQTQKNGGDGSSSAVVA